MRPLWSMGARQRGRLNSDGFLRRTLKKLAAQHRAAIVGAGRTFRRTAPARPAPRPMLRPAPAASAPAAGEPEPECLRQLAEAAFVQSRTAPAPRKVANGRAQDSGWEEF